MGKQQRWPAGSSNTSEKAGASGGGQAEPHAVLTCLRLHRDLTASSPILDPEEQELVLAGGLQAWDGDLPLVCRHRHRLGLALPVLVLDHEGVEFTLRDSPREAHGVSGHICHCQLPQAWLQGQLGGLSGWSWCWWDGI